VNANPIYINAVLTDGLELIPMSVPFVELIMKICPKRRIWMMKKRKKRKKKLS
jgi:hypothetical protein